MQGWKRYSIQEVAETQSGGTPNRSRSEYYNGTIPWLKTGELGPKYLYDTEEKISELAIKETSAKLIPENSVIVAMYGATIGKLSINKKEMASNQACCAIIPKKELYYEFLYYTLEFRKNDLIKMGSGAAQPNISQEIIRNYVIHVPEFKEQQKIADILSTWDKAIELKEKLIEQKKEQKKGLMQRLLTGKVRLPGFEGEWKKVPLERLCKKMKSGGTPKADNKEFYNGNIPFVKVNDITSSGKNLTKTEQYISVEGLNNSSAWLVPQNSILYSMYASVGFVSINRVEVATNQAIIALIPNKEVDLEYLYYALVDYKKEVNRFIEKGTQGNLNANLVKKFMINLPSLKEQKAIATILATIDKEIDLLEQELEALKQQKKGLMQLLLTGKVRVKC